MHRKERTTDGHRFTQIRRAFLLATGFWLLPPVGLADGEGEHYSHSMGEKVRQEKLRRGDGAGVRAARAEVGAGPPHCSIRASSTAGIVWSSFGICRMRALL